MLLIIVTLMLTVPTPLVASLVPVTKASLEMAPAAFVVSYRAPCIIMMSYHFFFPYKQATNLLKGAQIGHIQTC